MEATWIETNKLVLDAEKQDLQLPFESKVVLLKLLHSIQIY